ncbi:dimer_Tnp_hAT domain-containing protein [Trichonephila clavipes]|nr:dimer_Tnp_hAT domain-containing protein [Trichonephila clavipes]
MSGRIVTSYVPGCSQQLLENCVEFLSKEMHSIKIDDNSLFEEIRSLNAYLNSDKLEQLENQHVEIDRKWVEIFNHFKIEHIPYKNLVVIFQFTLRCPGTKAAVEFFSIDNDLWTREVQTPRPRPCVRHRHTNAGIAIHLKSSIGGCFALNARRQSNAFHGTLGDRDWRNFPSQILDSLQTPLDWYRLSRSAPFPQTALVVGINSLHKLNLCSSCLAQQKKIFQRFPLISKMNWRNVIQEKQRHELFTGVSTFNKAKLKRTNTLEKIVLPTKEVLTQEKVYDRKQQVLQSVTGFDRSKLRKTKTVEKNFLPTKEG